MNLPPHGRRICVGLDLHGVKEPCIEPVEDGSPFPYCREHRIKVQTAPRKRTCSGATVYDAAMRPRRVECENLTGDDEVHLCAHCRVIEARERERAKKVFQDVCPHCGRSGPRSKPSPAGPDAPRSVPRRHNPRYPARPQSEPQRYTFNTGIPPYKRGDDE